MPRSELVVTSVGRNNKDQRKAQHCSKHTLCCGFFFDTVLQYRTQPCYERGRHHVSVAQSPVRPLSLLRAQSSKAHYTASDSIISPRVPTSRPMKDCSCCRCRCRYRRCRPWKDKERGQIRTFMHKESWSVARRKPDNSVLVDSFRRHAVVAVVDSPPNAPLKLETITEFPTAFGLGVKKCQEGKPQDGCWSE